MFLPVVAFVSLPSQVKGSFYLRGEGAFLIGLLQGKLVLLQGAEIVLPVPGLVKIAADQLVLAQWSRRGNALLMYAGNI